MFDTAIKRIIKWGSEIDKGELYTPVIIETTLVEFLPMLDWSDDRKKILIMSSSSVPSLNDIDEAKDDDVNAFRLQLSRIRRGQNKFRFNLFKVYGIQCFISKCSVEQVLHACHISPHSVSGDNRVSNGILLRADLHELFDLNLVAIHPETKQVHVSNQLKDKEYRRFVGVEVCSLKGMSSISVTALMERWGNFVP
ncbi:HNH endonuclease [Candidatus Pollutiaquabacter sp.]|uniref:HNH endonuclease n=1 Tax=Candidatus Pollutiaquabacter sp. TaxID=3416354 RepID=UPI003CA270BF|nr:HNH endonuclease [Bacteroidota bacterium]